MDIPVGENLILWVAVPLVIFYYLTPRIFARKKLEGEPDSITAIDTAPNEKRSSYKISMPRFGAPVKTGLLLLVLVLVFLVWLYRHLSLVGSLLGGLWSFLVDQQSLLYIGLALIFVLATYKLVWFRWVIGILVFSLGAYWIDDWHKYNTSPTGYFTYLFSDTWDFPFNTCNGIGLCKYEQYYGEKTIPLYTPIGKRLCFERVTHDVVVGISVKDPRTGNWSKEYRLEEGSDASIEFKGIKKTDSWRIQGLNLKRGGSPLQFKIKYTKAGTSCPRPLR